MTFTSPNHIKIGRAPDFVMRLGKMDIYHKANIHFFSPERKFLDSAIASNRSLQTVAADVAGVLNSDVNEAAIPTLLKHFSMHHLFKTPRGYILVCLRLPARLAKDAKSYLYQQFHALIEVLI